MYRRRADIQMKRVTPFASYSGRSSLPIGRWRVDVKQNDDEYLTAMTKMLHTTLAWEKSSVRLLPVRGRE
jgi:hypothetical protein